MANTETIVAMPSQPGVPPQGFGPTSLGGLGIDPAGNVYFTGTYLGAPTSYIFRVNDDGTLTHVYGSAANPLLFGGFIPSLAVDSNSNAWLGSAFVNSAGAYTLGQPMPVTPATAGPPSRHASTLLRPVFAPNGDLYLLDGIRIRKLTGLSARQTRRHRRRRHRQRRSATRAAPSPPAS